MEIFLFLLDTKCEKIKSQVRIFIKEHETKKSLFYFQNFYYYLLLVTKKKKNYF